MADRDEFLDAVMARVRRVMSTGDAAPALDPAAATEASALAAAVGEARDPEAWYALVWLHWYRFQAAPEGGAAADRDAALRNFLRFFLDGTSAALPQGLMPFLFDYAEEVARAVTNSYQADQADALVTIWQRVAQTTPDEDRAGRWTALCNLGAALLARYKGSRELTDLDSAITATEAAVTSSADDDPGILVNLGIMLHERYLSGGVAADLDAAVTHLRNAAAAAPVSADFQQVALVNLGNVLHVRYAYSSEAADLDEAISVTEQALALDPADIAARSNLGLMLTARFGRSGDPADIDAAIASIRAALDGTPADHPNRCGRLTSLSGALSARYRHAEAPEDIDEAIAAMRMAVTAAPRGSRGLYQERLGDALFIRFNHTGQAGDLDEAIAVTEAALRAIPRADPHYSIAASSLGRMLESRFRTAGTGQDLDTSIGLHQRALADGDPGQIEASARSLAGLTDSLGLRASRTGAAADLDAVIAAARAAALAAPAGHPESGIRLSNAAVWLWERFNARHNGTDLDEAAELARAAVRAGLPDDADRPVRLLNLAAILTERFQRSGERADIDDAVTAATSAVEAMPVGYAGRAAALGNLIGARNHRYRLSQDLADLSAAIAASDAVLPELPVDEPEREKCVANLAGVLRMRYEHTRSTADLNDAITRIEAAAGLGPQDHVWPPPNMAAEAQRIRGLLDTPASTVCHALGWLFIYRAVELGQDAGEPTMAIAFSLFQTCLLTGDEEVPGFVLDAVAEYALLVASNLHQQAQDIGDPALTAAMPRIFQRILARLPAGHQLRAACLLHLGTARWEQFELGGAPMDLLDAAEASLREAAASPAARQRWAALNMLVHVLFTRYSRTGDTRDLTLAVEAAGTGTDAAPDEQRAEALSTLHTALVQRFIALGRPADLDEATAVANAAAELTGPGDSRYASRLAHLCSSLRLLFEHRGDAAALQRGVELASEAAATAGDGETRAQALRELSTALCDRYNLTGEMNDVHRAAAVARDGMRTEGVSRDERVRQYMALGLALRLRATLTGSEADIDESVDLARAVLAATPDGHSEYPIRLTHLADALRARFQQAGTQADLEEAVTTARTAADSSQAEQATHLAIMACLGRVLRSRFEHGGDPADLDSAITAFSAAVSGRDLRHGNQAPWLATLASALGQRAWLSKDPADLPAAIGHLEDAIAVTADIPVIRAGYRAILSGVLHTRYEVTGGAADLDAAIENLRIALRDTPPEDPGRPGNSCDLGRLLELRGGPADRDAAAELFGSVIDADHAAASMRINAAVRLAGLIRLTHPGRAAASLETAVRLLPEVAPRRLDRDDQQYALETMSGVASQAAELILAEGNEPWRVGRALQLLETGRGILLSQALELSEDLAELHEGHPELAVRFERIRDQLDAPGDDLLDAKVPRRHLADELSRTLTEIRGKDGFETFGLPPSITELIGEASQGPIVVFNAGRNTGHAILVTAEGISALELPHLTRDALVAQVNIFNANLRGRNNSDISATLEWLWDNAAGPVLHALGYDAPPAGEPWPRVWWVPSGLLGLLPLHAAGYHACAGTGESRDSVLDRVLSSYTPTIRALRHARQRPVAPQRPLTALVVAMPTTPGVRGRLSYVPAEVEMLRFRLFQPIVLTEPGPEGTAASPLPTTANVLARLPGCPIVHFACHGTSDPRDPSRSGLLLHDHEENRFTVSSLTSLHLRGAQLAYLSACRTAAIDVAALADEAIHLVSAFQLAGYPHVIGTLWEINDEIAVEVAEGFYQALHTDDQLTDVGRSAHAISRAVRTVRARYPGSPSLWAAYMHAGA